MPPAAHRAGLQAPVPVSSASRPHLQRRALLAHRRLAAVFQESAEGIPTNILADRLARLVRAGLAERTAYQKHPPRHDYRLTAAGEELRPVLGALAGWGLRQVPGSRAAPAVASALRG